MERGSKQLIGYHIPNVDSSGVAGIQIADAFAYCTFQQKMKRTKIELLDSLYNMIKDIDCVGI